MAKAIRGMEIDKKPTYQELERQIAELKSERKQDYKELFDNSTISIWNEDFTRVFEEIERLRKLEITNIKKYLKKNPDVLFSLIQKLKINSVNSATLKLFKAENNQDFFHNLQSTFGHGADKVFAKLIIAIWKKKKTFTSEVNYKTLKGDEFEALFSIRIPQTLLEQKTVPVTIQSISALRAAESAKKESILKLQQAQKLGKMGSWEWEWDTDTAYWSNEMYEIYGVKRGEFKPTSNNVRDLIFPEDRAKVQSIIKKLFNDDAMEAFEFRIVRSNNEIRYLSILGIEIIEGKAFGVTQDITDRKIIDAELINAKEKAEESKNHLNNIINNIGDPVFVKDDQSRLVIVNDALCEFFGYNREDIIGKTLAEVPSYANRVDFLKIDRQLIHDGIESINEESLTLREGEPQRISTRKTRFIDSEGNIFIVGVIHDITERFNTGNVIKEAKERAEENEERFRILMLNLEAGVVVHAPDTSVVQCNHRASEILGVDESFLIGKSSPDVGLTFVNPDSSPISYEEYPVNKIASNKEPVKDQVAGLIGADKDDVKWLTINGFPVFNSTGEIIEIVTVFIDITEQRQNEKDKLASKLLLDKTAKELTDAQALAKIGSWLVKPSGMKMEWSKEMYHIWGFDYRKDHPEYQKVVDRVHPDDIIILKDAVDKAVTLGIPYNIEYRVCIPNQPEKTVRAICQPVIGEDGNVLSLAGTNQDITEQKILATELIRAKEKAEESDRLKSAFLANLSHEMRTPMNGILGFSELLRRKNISDEKKDIYLELIEKEGHRLLSFISNIVDISKIESNIIHIDSSHINVNTLINDLYSKYQIKLENKGVSLLTDKGLGEADSFIETDANKLVQIISNLLENAIKFTKEGSIEFGYSLSGQHLKFYVKDSGIGIDTEEQKNIFDRFTQGKREQTHNHGVGLGLSIVKGLINILNGEVWIESNTGIGSTFFFTIPYKKVVNKTAVINGFNETTLENGDFTILIAEDDNLSFLYIQACLSDYNCAIIRAVNGKEAVKLVNQNSNIDLVLMDINMPEMDGNEALTEIRKTNKEITIIAQTGLAMSGDKEKMLNAGFDDYISKPISTTQLISTINKHLKLVT